MAKADGTALACKVIALMGMASLWMCLQASGFFPLSLIPSVGCFGVREVAGGHLAYSVALAGIAVAALVGSRWFKGSLNRAAVCVVLGVCDVFVRVVYRGCSGAAQACHSCGGSCGVCGGCRGAGARQVAAQHAAGDSGDFGGGIDGCHGAHATGGPGAFGAAAVVFGSERTLHRGVRVACSA